MISSEGFSKAIVVGTGSAGYRHASALRRHSPELSIAMVRRPTSTQPTARFDMLGVDYVTSVEQAASAHPDIAIVAGPGSTHLHDAILLAASGAHMLVEKPLATSSSDAR